MKSRNNKLQSAARKKEAQGGSSCHQCKSRRNCSDLTYCTSNLDKKKKQKCRKKYCEHCLRKFYRESPAQINEKPTWKCPSCRKICCCAACRRREMRDKENGTSSTTTTAPTHAPTISEPRIASTTQQRPPPSMGIEYPANGDDSPPSLNPFASSASSTSSFKALYAIAQMPSVKKHIKYILSRKDITDAQRVESIATLLRGSSSKSSRPKHEDMKGEDYDHLMGGRK
mmetsp:Transcript_12379/g.17213  ORF Transcript_12379/g.17213 Transcript_12379/m.17213 type:complete len:228 (-) Transcript_12379:454-1137(-)